MLCSAVTIVQQMEKAHNHLGQAKWIFLREPPTRRYAKAIDRGGICPCSQCRRQCTKGSDQSKQFSWQFGSIQTKAFPNPDQPPLAIFLINQYFCTKNKIIDNEKWKLLETLQYTIKEFNNYNVVCSTMHCPDGSRWGGAWKGLHGFCV